MDRSQRSNSLDTEVGTKQGDDLDACKSDAGDQARLPSQFSLGPRRSTLTIDVLAEIHSAHVAPKMPDCDVKRFSAEEFELYRAPDSPLTSQGTYMLKNRHSGQQVGVFKPTAEERAANIRRKLSLSIAVRQGIIAGDAAIKEAAAYLLDFDHAAGVPKTETVLIETPHGPDRVTKGSLQEFKQHMCTSEDIGPSMYSKENVHAIALLDLRLFNLDRHVGNLLVERSATNVYRLIPIDHGFSLPNFRQLSDALFCWSSWKQAYQPFSEPTKAYIAALQPARDIVDLKRLGLRDECILTYVICTMFVQECVEAGRTLADMADCMQHDLVGDSSPSMFEALVQKSSHDSGFDDFQFDDGDNTWSSERLQSFLNAIESNVCRALLDDALKRSASRPDQCPLSTKV